MNRMELNWCLYFPSPYCLSQSTVILFIPITHALSTMTSEGGTRKLTFWLKLLQTARRYQETCVSTEKREWLLLLLIIGILFLFRVISSREFKAGNGDATIHAAKKETVGLGLATPAECNLKSGKKFKANVYEGERNIGSLLHETSRKAPIPSPVVKNPIFRMDANRYIVPILEGGANNQLFEFREAVYVAIKLNRTLVIPRFFKHFTDRWFTFCRSILMRKSNPRSCVLYFYY